jgi:translation elongation factor EF-G
VLCEEAMRGIRFNILDVTLHADAIHRGAGQIMPTTKRVMYACQIKSKPGLMEPMYLCDITVPGMHICPLDRSQQSDQLLTGRCVFFFSCTESAMSGVYTTLNARRGIIESKEDRAGTPLTQIRAFLPGKLQFNTSTLHVTPPPPTDGLDAGSFVADIVLTQVTMCFALPPVLESFGFAQLLRQNTSGQAFPQVMLHPHHPTLSSSHITCAVC